MTEANPNERRADGQHAPRLPCGCFPRRAPEKGEQAITQDDPRHGDHEGWHRERRLAAEDEDEDLDFAHF